MVDLGSFITAYFETMVPFFVLAILTLIWFVKVDYPRLDSRNWVRVGSVPITHHYFEVPAFFSFGWAIKVLGFPAITVPAFMVVIAIATYPLVHRFESNRKSGDPRSLIVATFLLLEVSLAAGFLV